MVRKSCFCFSVIFFVLVIAAAFTIVTLFFTSIDSSLIRLAFAQVIGTTEDTFSAKGPISSLITRTNESTTTNTTLVNTTKIPTTSTAIPPPYRITGTWNLNVTNGNVTNFKANFAMAPVVDTRNYTAKNNNLSRTYEINNFTTERDKYIVLNGDGTAFILGGADVKSKNGTDNWKNVNTVIIIDRLNNMKLILDSNATKNHFNSLILGTADSVKDHTGREMKTSIGASLPTGNMTGSPTTIIPPGVSSPPSSSSPPSFPTSPPTTPSSPSPPSLPPPAANLPP